MAADRTYRRRRWRRSIRSITTSSTTTAEPLGQTQHRHVAIWGGGCGCLLEIICVGLRTFQMTVGTLAFDRVAADLRDPVASISSGDGFDATDERSREQRWSGELRNSGDRRTLKQS